MFRRLYARTLELSRHRHAVWWLGVIAFIESSFFPIPADVLFLPMALAAPHRAMRYALVATLASCAGGAFGYAIGYFGYEQIALPVLEALGKAEKLDHYRALLEKDPLLLWGLLLSSGLAHLPPIKIVTILSGFSGISFTLFMVSAIIGRGARFFLLAWLLKRYGVAIQHFIETRFQWVAWGGVLLLALLYTAYKTLT